MNTSKNHTNPSMTVLALGCHPDDIEFMMGGTLLLLRDAGVSLHYCNLADGSLGSGTLSKNDLVKTRALEAKQAATLLDAVYHKSMGEDLGIFYEPVIIRKVASLIRTVDPDILLLPAIDDYMEDHMNTARIGITAAFSRSMPLYETLPPRPPTTKPVAVYHAMPYGLKNGQNIMMYPEFFINVTSVIEEKSQLLSCHKSQKDWLDASQQVGSYVKNMRTMGRDVGTLSKQFLYAEGWRRHNPLGYSAENYNPLVELLHTSFGEWP